MNINKYFIFLACLLVLTTFVVAEDSIGRRQDAQINTEYFISQPCATCTYINISVYTRDGIVLDNVEMVNNGTSWIYNFTPTTALRHDVNGIGDMNGINDSFAFWFDATLSGQQNNSTIIISDIVLMFVVFGIALLIAKKHSSTDFKKWDKNITDNHKNMGETMAKGFVYSLFKNTFIWFYFLGWILLLILKDVIYRFNSADIYSYFELVANVYSLGLYLVLVFMIGLFFGYMKQTIETLSDNNWGIGNEE